MDNRFEYQFSASPEERAARRAQRTAARKERERRRRRRLLLRAVPLLAAVGIIAALALTREPAPADPPPEAPQPAVSAAAPARLPQEPAKEPEEEEERPYAAVITADTETLGAELPSAHAVVIDLETGHIVSRKGERTVISPASMTKILTLLVAVEHLDQFQLEDTFTIHMGITNYSFSNDCSVAGFELDEPVPVEHLLYGCILPSGAEASLALAEYVAGSHEKFVELMNEKAEELGLSKTARFSNCVGIYDENNVCTVYDMAMILKAAMDNDLARQVLTTKVYEIPPNDFHAEGMVLSNWFLRRIEDHVDGEVEVLGAKTGYVDESGNCAASFAKVGGKEYICVTADASGSWRCIKDHVWLYDRLTGGA